jgi:hypothetical protein
MLLLGYEKFTTVQFSHGCKTIRPTMFSLFSNR